MFNNPKKYAPSIKNKAIHVKKVSVGSLKSLANPASFNRAGTITPGRNTNTKFAPKSNRQALGYKAGPRRTGGK